MTENSPSTSDAFQLDPDSTWIEAVEAFQADAAAWLTPADAPQLMALRSIAKELDGGKFQAALISQFTLIHRALLSRRPGETPTDPGEKARRDALGPSLFEQLGGAWSADQ
ncbi:hypothetical protein K8F61_18610 [Microbacterium resistens]|uniref:DUF222 domain-containing protein n=1 Tax=Microbacterium resistens TaxID=156977 RepID=A0ABY3RR84_9MICO|nr:hypothetical protein [Microbacterium resistens]UGS26598.1 hypothetical protein K8F61_18610 [Microbacterium resistens]